MTPDLEPLGSGVGRWEFRTDFLLGHILPIHPFSKPAPSKAQGCGGPPEPLPSWTSRCFIAGSHRDKQPLAFALPYTPAPVITSSRRLFYVFNPSGSEEPNRAGPRRAGLVDQQRFNTAAEPEASSLLLTSALQMIVSSAVTAGQTGHCQANRSLHYSRPFLAS